MIRKIESDRRRAKLDDVHQQIESGSLTIRQMTPEERALYPKRPATERRRSYWSKVTPGG